MDTYKGCRAKIPYFSARRPVIKGSAADPATPIPATSPTEPVNNHLGRTRVMCWTSNGNIGPKTSPTTDIWIVSDTKVNPDSLRTHGDGIFDDGGYEPNSQLQSAELSMMKKGRG